MVVFSKEFGSDDPFVEAVQAARWMGQNDVFAFAPHIGIASGAVMVGYVGSPLRFECSVFGGAVALAARCSKISPEGEGPYGASMAFPASEWEGRDIETVLPPDRPDIPLEWKLHDERSVDMKNLGAVTIHEIVRHGFWSPGTAAELRATETLKAIDAGGGRHWPRS